MTEEDATPSLPTIHDRVFRPDPNAALYHYCSTATFLAVVEGGKLRFSDVNMMNDARETAYGYGVFESAATAALKLARQKPELDGLDVKFLDSVDAYISSKQLISHPVISCFSKDPDVLSQWRGYSDNAQGWAIGFDANALSRMPITLFEVLYDRDRQIEEVRNELIFLFLKFKESGKDFKGAVGQDAARLASYLLAYKHSSFREEQEVRAVHELRVDIAEDGWQLVDEGGVCDGSPVAGETIRFRAAGADVIAYVDIPLARGEGPVIRELWFGPRNQNGPGNALYPLSQHGYRSVALHHSASSFRG
ncbi:DUF2971 domain-containing protein [Sphingomonas sp. BAUL-RG-20F-R05-02]|uniref:DUF2971 domain-containing protein n=1 Tax=Sphingomonas sp. BAUL-RG-20F-R05-02 TaxID=2914830 RepID=UPI001F5A06B4|nr:DUF2971 domain-containing protein [Sphingomonas sp. BAUL-RG-20F-R05-02]